jgi:hypothetical protein
MVSDVICINLKPWAPLVALAVAIVAAGVGWAIVELVDRRWLKYIPCDPHEAVKGVQDWLLGVVERLVFAPAFYLAPKEAAAGALVWLGLKMAANWQHPPNGNDLIIHRRRSVRALLLGFISLAVAGASGLLARWPCAATLVIGPA